MSIDDTRIKSHITESNIVIIELDETEVKIDDKAFLYILPIKVLENSSFIKTKVNYYKDNLLNKDKVNKQDPFT